MKLSQAWKEAKTAGLLAVTALLCSIAGLSLYLTNGTNKLSPELSATCIAGFGTAAALGLLALAVGCVRGRFSVVLAYGQYLAGLWGFVEYLVSQANYIANVIYGVDGNSFTLPMILTVLVGLLGWCLALVSAILLRRAAHKRDQAAWTEQTAVKWFSKNRFTKVSGVMATALLLTLVITEVTSAYAPIINSTLNTASSKIVSSGEGTDFFPFEYTDAQSAAEYINNVYREAEAEGIVLLKNEGGTAPLSAGDQVSLFGTASAYINCSTQGTREVSDKTAYPTLKEALEADGVSVNEELWDFYVNGAGKTFGVTRTEINEVPWSRFPADLQESFQGKAAVVVLTRENGEGEDQLAGGLSNTADGSYLSISTEELELLENLTRLKAEGKYEKIIVLLNSALTMQVDFLENPEVDVDTCMWIGNVGSSGIYAVADALVGIVNPSGRLPETFVKDNLSSPAMASWVQNFGQKITQQFSGDISDLASSQFNYYAYVEGIYIGYRYYETRYEDVLLGTAGAGDYTYQNAVAYPFGYGLSYTSFVYNDFQVEENADGNYDVTVTVTNTGDVAGKHAVEIYLQKPYTDYDVEYEVEKASVELVGFSKTGMLEPGESETVTVSVEKQLFASYDRNEAATWILDAGTYYLAVGFDAHDALNNILAAKGITGMTDLQGEAAAGDETLAAVALEQETLDTTTYAVSAETGNEIVNQLDSCDMNLYDGAGDNRVTYVSRSNWEGTFPTKAVSFEVNEYIKEDLQNITTDDFAKKSYRTVREMPTLEADGLLTIAQLRSSEEETISIEDERWEALLDQVSFDEMNNMLTTAICATAGISSVGKPETKDSDGPAYIKETNTAQNGEDTGVRLPSEGVLAATFNVELIERVGEAFGIDAQVSGVNGVYAPGMNIQRTAFGGRNSEYFSEDPVLSGIAAMYEVQGLQSKGVIAYVKHFAFNEQDTNRDGAGVWFNEQAAREILLRPFEYAVSPSKGNAHAVMSAFIRVGTTWCSAHYGLITEILRNEWGFDGYVITDYAGGGLQYMTPLDGIMAGTDCWLLNGEMSFEAYRDNPTVVSAMRQATKRILYTTVNYNNIMNGVDVDARIVNVTPWWQAAVFGLDALAAVLFAAALVLALLSTKKKAA
ncbi:MAG: glycoside hydrolase family 3 N-terminal domain-containing protein [Eubacteriales bacterium]|nr:glycoside hydrolase family 3 N-terminal domain-containing protein [Eubacteriales bacterium]